MNPSLSQSLCISEDLGWVWVEAKLRGHGCSSRMEKVCMFHQPLVVEECGLVVHVQAELQAQSFRWACVLDSLAQLRQGLIRECKPAVCTHPLKTLIGVLSASKLTHCVTHLASHFSSQVF